MYRMKLKLDKCPDSDSSETPLLEIIKLSNYVRNGIFNRKWYSFINL